MSRNQNSALALIQGVAGLEDLPSAKLVGGKGAGLFRLLDWGYRLPEFLVIPAAWMIELAPLDMGVGNGGEWSEDPLIADEALLLDFGRRQRAKLLGLAFPEVLESQLADGLRAVMLRGEAAGRKREAAPGWAVRSSGLAEDQGDHSFAGIHHSELDVVTAELWPAIKRVWASAWSEEALLYRLRQGIAGIPEMAVVIQRMLSPQAAGVAFGMNPASGDRHEKVVSVVIGKGHALVNGKLNADHYLIRGEEIEENLVPAQEKGGEGEAVLPLLDKGHLLALAALLDLSYQQLGMYGDLEFAVVDDQLEMLQLRPMTGLGNLPNPKGGLSIWDNNNLIESYPDRTLPLTFSFVRRTYEYGYWHLSLLLMGHRKKAIQVLEAHRYLYEQMIGLIEGRMYYNFHTYYRLLSLKPGFRYTSRLVEKAMGAAESFDLPDYQPAGKWKEQRRLAGAVVRLLGHHIRLPGRIRRFLIYFHAAREDFYKKDLDALQPEALMELYKQVEQDIIARWAVPITNGFFNMLFFGLTKGLIKKWKLGDQESLLNDLLVGSGDIISTEPVRRLMELVRLAESDPETLAIMNRHSATGVRLALLKGASPAFNKTFEDYLDDFGDRCIGGELKMESISYRQEPARLIKVIQSYLRHGLPDAKRKDKGKAARKKAEQAVALALKGKPIRRWIFRKVLKRTRFLVSNRENLRFTRTQAFSMVRQLFMALGRRLAAEGVLRDQRDILYLSKDEVFDFIRGTSVNRDLQILADLRKTEYANLPAEVPGGRIVTRGMVLHANDFYFPEPDLLQEGDLKGLACCPGRVSGPVRVVTDPGKLDHLQGAILVARSTDHGWVKLFPSASGILLERGSLLSHAGIVSREMGIPSIMAVKGLLQTLRDGEWVEMDGSTGIIRRIEAPDGSAGSKEATSLTGRAV